MSSASHAAQPAVLSDVLPGERVRDVLLTVGFTVAIAASAQLAFFLPGNPVPITAQTFVVLAGAIALGTTRAAIGAALFAVLGATGVPLFAAASGATVGYIIGFVVAAALLGAWASRGGVRTVRSTVAAMVVGNLVIYAFGAVWLGVFLGSAEQGLMLGVVPFLIGDAIKLALAAAVVPTLWKLVGRG